MAVKLFNTLRRKKQIFTARPDNVIRMYTCGPTVYKSQHIGNYRTFIFEDILKRVLLARGYQVRHVMNITDVGHLVSDADEGEDKIEKEARVQKRSARDIARFFEMEFKKDIKTLNILPPERFTRATAHIKDQIKLIQAIEKKGLVYRTADGIYFDTSRISDYGKLAPKNIRGIRSGARVALKEKRNPTDFALWKFSPAHGPHRQMEWRSPWGIGFPGWHIECSAMSMKYLGPTLDIHCGGVDHIQVHHSCEIAQSEAVTGKPSARFWMHCAHLTLAEGKMAKSSPETNITLKTLKDRGFDPLDLRYLVLGVHYRKPLLFRWEALAGARSARLKLASFYQALPIKKQRGEDNFRKRIEDAVFDDLNTPRALAAFFAAVRKPVSRSFVLWADHIFGLSIGRRSPIPRNILVLVKKRESCRQKKEWRAADEIRDLLARQGFRVKDTKDGPVIHRI
ncbi:MAG: cysteine--tRNA ligase [Candidatus Ryanbacteria bacterium RIFCSPHIGHO2_12_FULL_47_12b]|uniref:Cysteine--tRNA ligase n=1 Tax=Candidatus Ryanbacteria bacterium RIFCSPLOWO2_12_FULL_47_9c TaxID=1802131 RepID=A0A1G2H5U7_9BACT|nr:MAG: Cysteine-tRNA ligase [Parcubacteria group bacterium GW2011_GWA2_47_10b]OGZ45900.1 MAG: cysteine--tRNA ligase [Candidatus Ryanbacteria bacterium RIFCSPHIGHO2_01_FULL_48_80]OGZ47937.1 MAG: cysteine--tRNA ligase [Candidatus Ryanbacteria bacterium RIFCSPHIGHO2_02_FULL_47_25]OGZ51591.1 MAG: cysteine--tRNA ligase [Candidatus Ryanbacteria bacterium RIFCSPHIGHO2_12_FULL_47_12b]OGZ52495.1 MAG: cysteine--tRNA ligase [Candidatus Ryanbacteria bacterium RIFCSPLOWO2_01_FULL_47_79]OGZ57845.1 MAG: cys